ncbi:Nucleolar complex-associated protein 3 [Spathaspora sp. JA1]|nr:Nucleolar complex-associated protein 3 [Spathaspora sp. JA1]
MGKRKQNAEKLAKRKKSKQEQEAQLSTGLFSSANQVSEDEFNDWENDEQDYELKPRNVKNVKTVESLPIKRSDGTIERVVREVEVEEEPGSESEEEQEAEPEQVEEPEEEQQEEEEDEYAHLTPQQKLIKMKEEIADLASKLIEDPEENIACLTRLRKMSESKNFVTSQLAIMALIPIFKSLAPSYKIRPLSDAEKREKVSREVAKLRVFEQSLVSNYIAYINILTTFSKVSYSNSANNKKVTSDHLKRGFLATTAATELCLSSLRHFNHRSELFSIVIKRLNRKPSNPQDYQVFMKCLRVLETLLKEDAENGDITFDVIRIMTKSIRDKKFRVDESVINVFLSLSLLEDYDPNHNRDDLPKTKLKKKDRVHLSKKERKARKERKEIDEEMRKAEQAITVEEREKYQAQVLKMVLTLYLEILKAGSHSIDSGERDAALLMGAVLEGLSRFGQMANFDLLGDFLEVLREIMNDIVEEHSMGQFNAIADGRSEDSDDIGGMYSGKQLRTMLLCIATSFSLVLNHQSTGRLPMTVDLSKFISTLYLILADLALDPDLEFSHKTLRLADPLSIANEVEKPAINVSTKAELLLRCLDFIFFRSKNGTTPRATSFTKRLYLSLLQTPEKTSLAGLKFIGKLMNRYDDSVKGLWNTEERISGEGLYTLGIEREDREVELERSNSEAATLWENVLLDKHYCPLVRDGSRSLMKNKAAILPDVIDRELGSPEEVEITLVLNIPKATSLKLRPSHFYSNITNWKYFLENKLNLYYTTLTSGSVIIIQDENLRYELHIEEINEKSIENPVTACIVDTDITLEMVPLNDKLANEQMLAFNSNPHNNIVEIENEIDVENLKSFSHPQFIPRIYKIDLTRFKKGFTLKLEDKKFALNKAYEDLFNVDLIVGLDKFVTLENFNYSTIDLDFEIESKLDHDIFVDGKSISIDFKDDIIVNKLHRIQQELKLEDTDIDKYLYVIPFTWESEANIKLVVEDGSETHVSEELEEEVVQENHQRCLNCLKGYISG